MHCSLRKALRVAFDLLLFGSVTAGLVMMLLGVVTPPPGPVSCTDPSIRMPYHKDTISVAVLFVVAVVVPCLVLILVECLVPPSLLVAGSSRLRGGMQRGWRYSADLLTGVVFMFFLNDLAKTLVGEPRPSFWDACRPNVTTQQCQDGWVTLSWRDCTNPFEMSHPRVVDNLKSFPSGHASISVFSSVIMVAYLQARLRRQGSRMLAPWLQLAWAVWTLVCCQSRVWDNRHHWWDVLAGGILGAFGAFATLHYLSDWFMREEDVEKSQVRDGVYQRQENPPSTRSSRTSVKRLISNTSEPDGHTDSGRARELRDINGTP